MVELTEIEKTIWRALLIRGHHILKKSEVKQLKNKRRLLALTKEPWNFDPYTIQFFYKGTINLTKSDIDMNESIHISDLQIVFTGEWKH